MKSISKLSQLILMYAQMYEMTAPECAHSCAVPHSCCSPEYCDLAEYMAKADWGVTLERTDHDTLKFMGPNGCTVAPHFRPLCTLHTCDIGSYGFKRNDWHGTWTKKYFQLRDEIDALEAELAEQKHG